MPALTPRTIAGLTIVGIIGSILFLVLILTPFVYCYAQCREDRKPEHFIPDVTGTDIQYEQPSPVQIYIAEPETPSDSDSTADIADAKHANQV